jgi:nucleoside-diphosphate-sugar epimerase
MAVPKVALLAGARGVIGSNLAAHLIADGGWEVIGLSRRGGRDAPGLRHLAVDLLDPQDTQAKLSPLTGVTHVFYAAYQDRPGWSELVAPNVAMLENTLSAIEPAAAGLRHVSLMQGYKPGPGSLPSTPLSARSWAFRCGSPEHPAPTPACWR